MKDLLNVVYQGNYKNVNHEIIEYDLPVFKKYLCGYIQVPESNRHFEDYSYNFDEIECHGGITYASGRRTDDTGHWIGFDTMHYFSNEKYRTIEFCKKECENIIEQLLRKEN